MLRIPISIAAFLVTASALGQSIASLPHEFRISGTAVNAVTGQALSKVEISIGPAEGPGQVHSVRTSADGRFWFENLTPQKYWLAARGRGFSMQRFNEHGEFSSAIAVGANKNSENLVFRVFPDATIVGTVADDQGDSVAGAQVMLFSTGVQNGETSTRLRAQTATDDQGHYHLAHVPEGAYYIAVSARPWYADNNSVQGRNSVSVQPGNPPTDSGAVAAQQAQFDVTYPLTFYPGVTDPESATPIRVKPGDRVVADVSLSAVPALHVRVSDSSIEPPALGPELRPAPFSVNLNERIFGVTVPVSTSFESVSPGQFQINGVPPGHFLLTEQTLGKDPTSREKQIDLADNTEIDAADGAGLASITGVVQLDSGQPLSRPMFLQLLSSSGENFSAPTSAKGEFQLNGVSPGKYEFSVFGRGDTFVKNISATGASIVGREVQIGADAAIQMQVTLSEGVGRINGTALRGGNPFAGAMIVLVPQDIQHNSPLVRRDQSDSDGTFSLYNVVPGAYTVVAIQNGWDLQWLSPDVLQPLLKGGEVVNVAAHGKYQIRVNVQ